LHRIAVYHAYPHQYAGAQRVVHELALRLPVHGWSVITVVPDNGPFPERLRRDALDACIVRAPRIWRSYGRALEGPLALPACALLPAYWLKLARAFRALQVDVVHCNDHRGMLLAGPAARLAGIPVLWHLHDAYGPRELTRFGGLVATHIVSNSRATLAALPVLASRRAKTSIVYFGIEANRERCSEPVANERPVVLCGARLHVNKGQDVLIQAVDLLRQREHNVLVQLAGQPQQGSERYVDQLHAVVREQGLHNHVAFLGFVEDNNSLWRSADVYVQPSREEPFGLGVLEAMMLAKPVVASAVGGLQELVVDGETGLLVPPEDPAALSGAIGELLSDPRLRERLGTAGAERARSVFGIDTAIAAFADLYDKLRCV